MMCYQNRTTSFAIDSSCDQFAISLRSAVCDLVARDQAEFPFGGLEKQRPILCDDAIEKINPGKDADTIGQLPSGDEKKLPAGSPEGAERVRGCVVDDSIMRKRAVIVGRQTADVHGSPPLFPIDFSRTPK
jgi:hypothetical protein